MKGNLKKKEAGGRETGKMGPGSLGGLNQGSGPGKAMDGQREESLCEESHNIWKQKQKRETREKKKSHHLCHCGQLGQLLSASCV